MNILSCVITNEELKRQRLCVSCSNPSCLRYPEEGKLAEVSQDLTEKLQQCYLPKCDERKTKMYVSFICSLH